jgi:hypothetical protein
MKAKTFVACVLTASALPLAPALAQLGPQPSGPQGTGAYGARNAAVPVPESAAPAYTNATPVPADSASRGTTSDRRADDVRRDAGRSPARRGMYDGPSWETNPPAPAP